MLLTLLLRYSICKPKMGSFLRVESYYGFSTNNQLRDNAVYPPPFKQRCHAACYTRIKEVVLHQMTKVV